MYRGEEERLTCSGRVVLETVLLRSPLVATLVLGHLDLPTPRDPRGAGVEVDVDRVALVAGRDPHVLARVVATDGGRRHPARVGHSQTVGVAVPDVGALPVLQSLSRLSDDVGAGQDQTLEIQPQFADLGGGFAVGVGAGVCVGAGGEGGDGGVGDVGAG